MKKLLFVIPFVALLGACNDPEPELPDPEPSSLSVKLTKDNSGLTNEDSTEQFDVSFGLKGTSKRYVIEIGPNCYAHETYDEFLIKKDGYIKSKCDFKVDRLIIDYMSKKGVNFIVENAKGEEVESHESKVKTEYPAEEDYGAVLEYPINGNAWKIKNTTEYKPAFYSVTVVFTL